MTSLLLVMLARTRPQVQESRIHGDQGDPRQSTGQSTLQATSVSPGGGRWEQWEGGTGLPSDLVQEVPLVCTPGPHEEGEEGEQEDQGVRCQEWVKQVELETHRRDSLRGGQGSVEGAGARRMLRVLVRRAAQEQSLQGDQVDQGARTQWPGQGSWHSDSESGRS